MNEITAAPTASDVIAPKPEPEATPEKYEEDETPQAWWRQLGSFLCARNPFYLISALLIIYAQSAVFTSDPLMARTEIPALILAGYTVLLAAVAVMIVRTGRVWDDARSILLLILVMFQVLPVCVDGLLVNTPVAGRFWGGGMLLLTVAISELLRRGLGLRLPKMLLAVYYGLLVLLTGWPVLLAEMVNFFEKNTVPAHRAILLFPVAAAALLLALLPIVRRGPKAFAANGTPWRWPSFPWSAFAVIAIGTGCRTFLMTISFIGGKGAGPYSRLETGFQLWMLIPLLAVLALLLTEHAARFGSVKTAYAAKFIPLLLPFLCLSWHPNAATTAFRQALGVSPLAVAMPLTLALLGWAWYRGLAKADVLFHLALAAAAAGALTVKLPDQNLQAALHWLPLAAFVGDMIIMSWRRRRSPYSFVAVTVAIVIAAARGPLEDSPHYFAAIAVLMLTNFYLHGTFFRDRFADACSTLAAAAIPLYVLAGLIAIKQTNAFPYTALTVIAVVVAMGIYGTLRLNRHSYGLSLAVSAVFILAGLAIQGWQWMMETRIKIPWALTGSVAALLAAVGISYYKGGRYRRNAKPDRED